MELPKWYGQRDPRWANVKLGFDTGVNDTIGNYGCLITCIAIMVDAFDYPLNQANPLDVNNWLKTHGGYANSDLVIWAKVPQITSMVDRGAYYGKKISDLANFLNEGNTLAICGVQSNGSGHFVLAYKAVGGVVWVHDPWTNTQRKLSDFGTTWSVAHLYGDVVPSVPVTPQPPVQPPVEPPVAPPVVVEKPPVVVVELPVVTPPAPVVIPEEKLNVGLLNRLLQALVDFISKYIK